jgi:hypothetical protein
MRALQTPIRTGATVQEMIRGRSTQSCRRPSTAASGHSIVETRNGSDKVLTQYVWGTRLGRRSLGEGGYIGFGDTIFNS